MERAGKLAISVLKSTILDWYLKKKKSLLVPFWTRIAGLLEVGFQICLGHTCLSCIKHSWNRIGLKSVGHVKTVWLQTTPRHVQTQCSQNVGRYFWTKIKPLLLVDGDVTLYMGKKNPKPILLCSKYGPRWQRCDFLTWHSAQSPLCASWLQLSG